jgi:hypothetical protein
MLAVSTVLFSRIDPEKSIWFDVRESVEM